MQEIMGYACMGAVVTALGLALKLSAPWICAGVAVSFLTASLIGYVLK